MMCVIVLLLMSRVLWQLSKRKKEEDGGDVWLFPFAKVFIIELPV